MKKITKITISALSILILSSLIIFLLYNYFYDKNNLSVKEEQWISDNKNNLIDVSIPKGINVFTKNGDGVFFEFLNSVEKETGLSFNKKLYDNYKKENNLSFKISRKKESELVFYEDYYVVVSNKNEIVNEYSELAKSKIGTTSQILKDITKIYTCEMNYTSLDSYDSLFTKLKANEFDYIIVPKLEAIDRIIENKLFVNYHLSDLVVNYNLVLTDNKTLNSIMLKKYIKFKENVKDSLFHDYLLNIYSESLDIKTADLDSLTNKVYKFGYIDKAPYFTQTGNKTGGIIYSYLNEFSKLTKAEFKYRNYKSDLRIMSAFKNKKIDLMFTGKLNNNKVKIESNLKNKFYLVSNYNEYINVLNLAEIGDKDIYVIKDSMADSYIKLYDNISRVTVKNNKELFKEIKNGHLVAIDSNLFDYYVNTKIKNANIRHTDIGSDNYMFNYQKDNDAFYKLFKTHINLLDDKKMINNGINSFNEIDKGKSLVRDLIKYLSLVLVTLILGFAAYISSRKNIKLKTRIKKDEKLKFVDVLTSLKNRNYLNEMKETWNKSKIYPQTIILIDLNNIKYLNDTFGHTEGDKQIMSMANILLKMQVDNSEIIRSDGNEFIIYMLMYNEKQVLNFIKKLMKHIKKLPYDYGAAIGFQMINDESMLIDDAINEAFIKMKNNKKRVHDDQ